MKFTRRDSATFFTSSLLIGILTDMLIRQRIFGLNFFVWTVAWTGIMLLAAIMKRHISRRFLLFSGFALLNSFLVYVRIEPVVQAWSVVITLVSLTLMTGALFAENFLNLGITNRAIEFISSIPGVIKSDAKLMYRLLNNRSESHKKTRINVGIIVAVILGLIFIGLFSGSDAVFRHQFSFIGTFFSSIGNWLSHYNLARVFSIIFWSGVAGAGLLTLAGKDSPAKELVMPAKKYFSRNDTVIILSTLTAVFGFFILIQIKYLFAGGTLPDGLTYANYARRGYGELLLATMLASAVIYAAIAFTREKAHTLTARILSNVLVVLNGIVVLSAWKRLSLYESAYGWTMTRFIARLGLICILLGSILLLFWVNKKISARRLFGFSWYAVAGVLMIAALLNPVGIITQKNISERPQRETKLDTEFIRGLSADSYPALCKYAATLKNKYPGEYNSLQNLAPNVNQFVVSKGLSAHRTTAKAYIDKYSNCLE
ncbi:MAG: conserved rane protein of unknown function [Candidatus Saccharibacteria bacterium]|nr:conserved rane protein of unknown function [Candidatus Saccharibacteria bacterium]